jgi:MFS family permease
MEDKAPVSSPSHGCFSLLKFKSIRMKFLIMMFIWFSMALSYYVLQFNLAHYLGSPSTIGMIMGLCEIAACGAAIILMEYGRRTSFTIFIVGAIIACFGAAFEDFYSSNLAQMVFLGVLRFGLAAALCVMFTLTSELFPTIIRSIAFGACSTLSRASSMTAPVIVELGIMMSLDPLILI